MGVVFGILFSWSVICVVAIGLSLRLAGTLYRSHRWYWAFPLVPAFTVVLALGVLALEALS